jgi:hypothetical protein
MYKAKCNIACGQRYFEAGREYTKKEIEGLDVNDFDIVDVKAPKEEAPKSMTNESVKPKKTKK